MTIQINDTCFHHKIEFDALYHVGRDLFGLCDLGFSPVSSSTACDRGYVAHLSIIDAQLFLTSIHIGFWPSAALHVKIDEAPIIYGVPPSAQKSHGFLFEGFQHPLAFNGALILGDEYIEDEHSQRSWLPLWDYKHVREVLFEAGHMTEEWDRSNEIAALLQKVIADKDIPSMSGMKLMRTLERWTNKCFSAEYRLLVKSDRS